jgi:hypothetical protein
MEFQGIDVKVKNSITTVGQTKTLHEDDIDELVAGVVLLLQKNMGADLEFVRATLDNVRYGIVDGQSLGMLVDGTTIDNVANGLRTFLKITLRQEGQDA